VRVRTPARASWLYPGITLAIVAAVVAVVLAGSGASSIVRRPAGPALLTVRGAAWGRPIAPGFVGLSLEYPALEAYTGSDPGAVDPVFETLVRQLAPGQAPVLRIGGDSTDWTWFPVASLVRPAGIRYSLSEQWLAVARSLTRGLRAHLILGINLEAGSRALARAEARALVDRIGAGSVSALELGNEPELYGALGWYTAPDGHRVRGRGRGYGFAAFSKDFASYGAALPPGVALAGPATGGPKWRGRLGQFVSAPRLGLVSLHSYPLRGCRVRAGRPASATIGHLLSDDSTSGLADSVARDVAIAHAHDLPVRIDELNSVSCGGTPGVSDTFASALWALQTLFEMARVGVDGVNIHTFANAVYRPFAISRAGGGRWRAKVAPEYYGLLMFAQAAPANSTLLALSLTNAGGQVHAWATRARDGKVRAVLVNDARSGTRVVAVRLPGVSGRGRLERLQAPSLDATSGVSIGGRSFGAATATGRLAGRARGGTAKRAVGRYLVRVPPSSAVMLTVGR
jgi:hypothetical protein